MVKVPVAHAKSQLNRADDRLEKVKNAMHLHIRIYLYRLYTYISLYIYRYKCMHTNKSSRYSPDSKSWYA